jgi:adenosylcobinamide-GDP ribazoletransferase
VAVGSARIRTDRDRAGGGGDLPLGLVNETTAAGPARLVADVADNLRFFTRLPLGGAGAAPDFRRIGWAAPLAGALVGALGAGALVAARALGFPNFLAATLAITAEICATGALHEDGLADVADGFGGGRDRDAKLAILRDSRIGTYGALALALSLLLRVEAVGALMRASTVFAAAALVLAGAAARAGALAPLMWLAPARRDGAGASVGALGVAAMRPVALTLAGLAAALGLATLEVVRALFACAIALGAVRLFVALARRQIGGQTGDVCGAAAALAEVAALLALLIGGRDA